jgi:hypothetical protein
VNKRFLSNLLVLVVAMGLGTSHGAWAQAGITLTPYTTVPLQAYPGGTTADLVIVVNYAGPDGIQGPMSGQEFSLSGANANDFQEDTNVTPTCFSGLSNFPPARCAVAYYFNAPATPGVYMATLTVSYVDTTTNQPGTATYTLTGTVLPVETPNGNPNLSFVPLTTRFAGTGSSSYSGNGGAATSAGFNQPGDIAFDSAGNAYISDTGNYVVRKVSTSGIVSIYAGTAQSGGIGNYAGEGGAATSAKLEGPDALAIDLAGNLYIADGANAVRVVNAVSGKITTFAGSQNYGFGYSGDGGPATSALLYSVASLAMDSKGNLYILERGSNDIRKVDTSGNISTYAGENSFYNQTYGHSANFEGFSGEGGPAASATFYQPNWIAIDATDNLYVSDGDDRIRKINPTTTTITTIAGLGAEAPYETYAQTGIESLPAIGAEFYAGGIALDPAGNFYIADGIPYANVGGPILKVDTTGTITQFPSTSSANYGGYLRFDSAGNMYIMDQLTSTVYRVAAQGVLAFGNQALSTTSAVQYLTLQNNGSAAINFSATPYVVAGNFAIGNSGTCSFSAPLAIGANCTVAVTFTPLSTGPLTGTITFASNSAEGSLVAHLSGTGTGTPTPLVVLNPTTVSFGTQTVLTTSGTMVVALSNTGTGPLTIASIALGGTNPTDFNLNTTACSATLAAGLSCNIAVTFTPAAAVSYSATLVVTDNAAGSPQTVTLSGTGTPAPAPLAVLNPTTVSFGTQTVATTSGAMVVALSNTGTAPLAITSIVLGGTNPGDFSLNSAACGSTLAAGSSCNISMTFTPAAALSYSATVTVTDNAAGSPQTATFSGTGTAAPAPVIALNPTPVAFGNVTVATTSAAMALTVSNTGNATLNLTSVVLGGTNPGAFTSAGGSCGQTLGAGLNCTLLYTFTPSSVASFSATVTIVDNAAGSPHTGMLTGAGVAAAAPLAALTPNPVAFPSTNVGVTATTIPVTLTNSGNAALTISSVTISGAGAGSFADTSGCGSSLGIGSSCTISVTFTPAAAGALTATLSVADNAAGSPQTTTLTGTGVAAATDFSVAAPVPAQSVQPGGVAQYTINVAALSGNFSTPVVLSVTGLPAGATASFNPPSVVPGSSGAATVLSVQTAALTGAIRSHAEWLAALLLIPLLGVRRKVARIPMVMRMVLFGALAMGSLITLTGCGGGGYFGQQPQTVQLTVTGTSGALQHSTTVTLTIQ